MVKLRFKSPDNSDESTPEDYELSAVSKKYDMGDKGFLTPAEQKAREMDTENQGKLSVEQLTELIHETMNEDKRNDRLRLMSVAFFGAVFILALSNLGTAFLAARLARDVDVDSSTGRMTVRGESDIAVATISGGQFFTFKKTTDAAGRPFYCINVDDLADVFASTFEGTSNSFVMEDENGLTTSYGLTAGGSFYNRTQACLGSIDSVDLELCTLFEPCDLGSGRRLLGPGPDYASMFRERVRQWRDPNANRTQLLMEFAHRRTTHCAWNDPFCVNSTHGSGGVGGY